MIGSSLPPTALPKAATLTDALISPSSELVSRDAFNRLRRTFERRIRTAAGVVHPDVPIRVDAYHLRGTTLGPDVRDRPFQWSPWTARRPIGVEVARACLVGARLSPLQASHEVIERLVRRANEGPSRAGTLAKWLSGLSTAGRAAVQAEAVVWATQLLTALDWTKLTNPTIGGDVSVVVPAASQILLRGRIEVRTPLGCPEDRPNGDLGAAAPTALFTMMFGRPTSTAHREMGLAALTAALEDCRGDVPARVVGWWPQCGRALVLPVDLGLLERTCEAVVVNVQSRRPTSRAIKSGATSNDAAAQRPTGRPAIRVATDSERMAS
jgi:hypothetical protein